LERAVSEWIARYADSDSSKSEFRVYADPDEWLGRWRHSGGRQPGRAGDNLLGWNTLDHGFYAQHTLWARRFATNFEFDILHGAH